MLLDACYLEDLEKANQVKFTFDYFLKKYNKSNELCSGK